MACETFIPKRFKPQSWVMINQVNAIINEYMAKGFVLTLRQLYYKLVARGYIENTILSYKRIGTIVNEGRLAGYIDWDAIEDRTRNLSSLPHWMSPVHIMKSCERGYRLDKWATQKNYCEVWIEKEALINFISRVCRNLDVPFFACRGYVSQSEQYAAGKRLAREASRRPNGEVVIFHFGDHDPSGIDMTRDNELRLDMFSGSRVRVERLALNMDQVEEYQPPPNPAKVTDSRYGSYTAQFGDESWELDALEPEVIDDLVRSAVDPLIDRKEWDRVVAQEATDKKELSAASSKWGNVQEFLRRMAAFDRTHPAQ